MTAGNRLQFVEATICFYVYENITFLTPPYFMTTLVTFAAVASLVFLATMRTISDANMTKFKKKKKFKVQHQKDLTFFAVKKVFIWLNAVLFKFMYGMGSTTFGHWW